MALHCQSLPDHYNHLESVHDLMGEIELNCWKNSVHTSELGRIWWTHFPKQYRMKWVIGVGRAIRDRLDTSDWCTAIKWWKHILWQFTVSKMNSSMKWPVTCVVTAQDDKNAKHRWHYGRLTNGLNKQLSLAMCECFCWSPITMARGAMSQWPSGSGSMPGN